MNNKEKRDRALRHISFSRIKKWRSGIKSFEEHYFSRKEQILTSAMLEGKEIDKLFSGERISENIIEDTLLKKTNIDFIFQKKRKIETTFEHRGIEHKIVGEIDLFDARDNSIFEVKVSKSYKIVQDARRQLNFYYFILFQNGIDVPKSGQIYLVKKDSDNKLTGEVDIIRHEFSYRAIENVKKAVANFINEVNLRYPIDGDEYSV